MSAPSHTPGFGHGVFAGFAGLIVLIQVSFAIQAPDYAGMYRDFGDITLPLLTRITIHPAWIWGASLVGSAAVAALLVKRPRSFAPYVVVAAAVLVAVAASYYYPRAPIYALAGSIQAN